MSHRFRATAPSNIALIKYMGKTDTAANRPTNTSLSYTLNHLNSIVELETLAASEPDRWEPLREHDGQTLTPLELSEKGASRFLAHLARIKTRLGYEGSFVVRSANDFPSDCGLASSASSFAALTRAALAAIPQLTGQRELPVREAADLSRQGSGSSCRSFFSPWSIWGAEGASAVDDLGFGDLLHQVIVVDDEKKAVSSSEAHIRVASSALFRGRPERAEERVNALIKSLRAEDWGRAFEITWAEFWDMHALFETSEPSFGYMTAGSLDVLRFVRSESWEKRGDGPLVTMDAGPNVHLLHRNDPYGRAFAAQVEKTLGERYKVFSSHGGSV
jgi:diphosphomevalonate decarboxylase